MYDNILFVRETVYVDGRVNHIKSLSRRQYEMEVGKALFYREIHGNKKYHRIRTASSGMHGSFISSQSYGNGCKSEYRLFDKPYSMGWRESEIVSDAYRVEETSENGHELVTFYAVVEDEIKKCVYDLTNKVFVG